MGKHDERIDVYIAGAAEFARPILEHLRAIVHQACPDVEETMKWSFPHFQYKGMLCSMAAFKEHCAFGFWKGSLILGKGKGESQGEGATARNGQEKVGMGHLGRITKIADLPPKKIMSGNIKEAMRLNDEGVKAPAGPSPKRNGRWMFPTTWPPHSMRTRRPGARSRNSPPATSGSTLTGSTRPRPQPRGPGGLPRPSSGWPKASPGTGNI